MAWFSPGRNKHSSTVAPVKMAGNAEDRDKRTLSLRLYDVLDKVGTCEKMRNMHKRASTTFEILYTVNSKFVKNELQHLYLCGSTYEGSVTPDLSSDVDLICCIVSVPVVLDPRVATPGVSLLIVSDAWTYPGYVKLQVIWDGLSLTRHHVVPCKSCDHDEVGRKCFRHFTYAREDGPAAKSFDKNGVHYLDGVGAFKCNALPLFVRHRLDMLRERRLISDGEFHKLNGIGCMFVGAGHFMSQEKKIEWRLSLSLQERHLMSKLNPTQHKVYILLKMIKRNIIEKVVDSQVFTSYHCKTCVLYAVQMFPTRYWTPDNLINCLMQCIKLLCLWLKKNFCPNIFNGDQNLFSKKGFSDFRKPLLHAMELILQSNNQFVTLLHTDYVDRILLDGVLRWKHIIDVKKSESRCKLYEYTVNSICGTFPRLLHRLCGNQYSHFSLIRALDSLQQTETITEHTPAETQEALGYMKPWFHLHIAKCLACLSYRCQDRSYSKQISRVTDFHLRKAELTDLVNVRLAKATILYKFEQYETCFVLLQQIAADFTHNVTRMCFCVSLFSYLYISEQSKRDRDKTMADMSVRKAIKHSYACCVVFLPSQFLIVPPPLQYEMFRSFGTQPGSRNEDKDFWFDWCVTDAKVYLYLMQYLVSKELQKEVYKHVAMDNIRAIIEEDNIRVIRQYEIRQLGHRETAYNVLGWIYMQEQRYGDAIQCFLKSWNIRPFHNAAKFHMRDLMAKVSEARGQGSA